MSLPDASHRPWPLPDRPWFMFQGWHDLLFAHWPVPQESLAPGLPRGLSLDTFQGQAWISLVPFRMTRVRPRGLPPLPWLSSFPELNLRTYVVAREEATEKPGVWFFSLDAANPVAVAVARWLFHLPYFRARMACVPEGEAVRYWSQRTHRSAPPAVFQARYGPSGPVYRTQPGSLEEWLTERYCLYAADGQGRLYRTEIHHAPWPVQPAWAEIQVNSVAQAAGIPLPETPPLLQFARRLDVVAWPPERIFPG